MHILEAHDLTGTLQDTTSLRAAPTTPSRGMRPTCGTVDPGDEVILTDPTYAGLVNRVRLVGGVPHFVPYQVPS
jgi:dTDP-4-amino-4,6-dideoxygalactose transaminase